jgi:photosystem II stability/assembly factor-like uncharacterized protein
MCKYFFIYLMSLILVSCSKNKIEAEVQLIESTTNLQLNKVIFFDQLHGFIVGGDRYQQALMLETFDGGSHWQKVSLPQNVQRKAIYGIEISPSGKIITVGFGGTIYVSNDTGKTFQYVQHNSWREFQDIAIRDNDTCFIVGGNGFENGFITKQSIDGTVQNPLQEEWTLEVTDVDFPANQVGYLSGYGAILKTIDAGKTWSFTDAKNDYFKEMSWKNEQEGVAVGYAGSIIKTIDGGGSWKTIRNGNSITKKKIHFLAITQNSSNRYVAVGEKGCVCISDDGGTTWQEFKSVSKEDLRSVIFINENTCLIVGTNGVVFRLII